MGKGGCAVSFYVPLSITTAITIVLTKRQDDSNAWVPIVELPTS